MKTKKHKEMDNFEFYKELYFKENERRSEVLNALNIPIAILTALITSLFYIVTNFDYNLEYFLSIIFILLSFISFITLVISIYYLILAFGNFSKSYEYKCIAYTNELYSWQKELIKHFESAEDNEKTANDYFKNYLAESFSNHTAYNMSVNDEKYELIYSSKKYLILSIIIIFFNLLPFGFNYFNKKGKTEIANAQFSQNLIQKTKIKL